MDIEKLLEDRKVTHGDWRRQALCAHDLKVVFTRHLWCKLSPTKAEAIDAIMMKISRICCGDPNTVDHWHDIAGYAMLGSMDEK